MKALLLVSLLAQSPSPAAPLVRADAHLVAGWQNLRKPQAGAPYNDWLNGILYGGGGAGWYWTDNLKTQIDVGAGTRQSQYGVEPVTIDGRQTFQPFRVGIRESNVAISQQFQFFRNQWFHPHAGAGLELARETSRVEYQLPERSGPETGRWLARPFADLGFKAYMTRRAFFLGDVRLMFRGGVDEVLFRTGFGVDF
jgi:hypothetical protein